MDRLIWTALLVGIVAGMTLGPMAEEPATNMTAGLVLAGLALLRLIDRSEVD